MHSNYSLHTLKMSSFTSNTLQINFDVFYLLLDDSMVVIFKTLEASGLKDFSNVLAIFMRRVYLNFLPLPKLSMDRSSALLEIKSTPSLKLYS